MTKEEVAAVLNGREYGSEYTEEECQKAGESPMLIAYGTSANVPHATFDVMKDGQFYCTGIVVDYTHLIKTAL